MNKEVELISLDKLLDNLHFKMEVESLCRMHSSDHLKTLASTIYYLEELERLKNGSKRNGKVSKRTKRQGDGDSSGSEGEE